MQAITLRIYRHLTGSVSVEDVRSLWAKLAPNHPIRNLDISYHTKRAFKLTRSIFNMGTAIFSNNQHTLTNIKHCTVSFTAIYPPVQFWHRQRLRFGAEQPSQRRPPCWRTKLSSLLQIRDAAWVRSPQRSRRALGYHHETLGGEWLDPREWTERPWMARAPLAWAAELPPPSSSPTPAPLSPPV